MHVHTNIRRLLNKAVPLSLQAWGRAVLVRASTGHLCVATRARCFLNCTKKISANAIVSLPAAAFINDQISDESAIRIPSDRPLSRHALKDHGLGTSSLHCRGDNLRPLCAHHLSTSLKNQ